MKFTLEPSTDQSNESHPHRKVCIEVPHDDLNIDEIVPLLKALLLGFGFHHETVDGIFNAE